MKFPPAVIATLALLLMGVSQPSFAELGIQPVTQDLEDYQRLNPEDRLVDPAALQRNNAFNQGLNDLDDDFNNALAVVNDGRQEDYTEEVGRRLQQELDNVNAGGWRPVTQVMDPFIEGKIPEAKSEYAIKPNR